jgi:hypothetical protein
MRSRRLASALVLAALALAPGVAVAGVPVVIYPFRVPGLSAEQRSDLHGILEAALASASRRGVLSPRSPILLPTVCGDRPTATCLAEAGRGAFVLTGRGEVSRGIILVSATLCDPKGTRTREVRFLVDLVIQNLRPVGESIVELETEIGPDGLVARDERAAPLRALGPPPASPAAEAAAKPPPNAGAKPPALAAAAPPRPQPIAAAPAAVPAPKAAPANAAAAVRVQVDAPAPVPSLWKRKTGPWLTGLGVALLAGGAAVGYLNHDLAQDLDSRYANRQLTAADRASYDRVRTYNVISTTLFAAGGAAAAAGAWIWISAPPSPGEPAVVGAGGRF